MKAKGPSRTTSVVSWTAGRENRCDYTQSDGRRGPTGVIGTNKTDAKETVAYMMEDLREAKHLTPEHLEIETAEDPVNARQPQSISYDDCLAIDKTEVAKGRESSGAR